MWRPPSSRSSTAFPCSRRTRARCGGTSCGSRCPAGRRCEVPWTIHVNATGTQDIARSLRALEKQGLQLARDVLREKTAKMVALARAFAPREEGDLIERIHATDRKRVV